MNINKTLSWTILLAISLSPIIPWYFGPTAQALSNNANYADITHAIGQLLGLIGMTMFALNFLLSTRIKIIEDMFGGLDKVYIAHGILGGTALILILFHPIFLLLKYFPLNAALAAKYLLPGGHFAVDFGIYALLGLIALIMLTLYSKLKYDKWKISHKFLGAIFFLAVLHIFFIRSTIARDNIFDGYYTYVAIVSLVGIFGFVWSLFFKDRIGKRAIYKIESMDKKRKDIYDINMTPEYKPLSYKSGQFIFVRFYNRQLSSESHPFSIASKSNNPKIRIVVKNLGDFTNELGNAQVGDLVSVEGPYGRFNHKRNENSQKDQIWLAAGIGITPFIGMAEDLVGTARFGKVDLYYSVRSEDDFISINTFKQVEKANKKFKLLPWITNNGGRLNVDSIVKNSGNLYGKEIFICGPKEFKESLKNDLILRGVPVNDIHEEDFGFR